MRDIFTPKNEEEAKLASIIKENPILSERKKALKILRKLTGKGIKLQPYEYYRQIPGKPSYMRRFESAILYEYYSMHAE